MIMYANNNLVTVLNYSDFEIINFQGKEYQGSCIFMQDEENGDFESFLVNNRI